MTKISLNKRDSRYAVIAFASGSQAVIPKEEAASLGYEPTGELEALNQVYDEQTEQPVIVKDEHHYEKYA